MNNANIYRLDHLLRNFAKNGPLLVDHSPLTELIKLSDESLPSSKLQFKHALVVAICPTMLSTSGGLPFRVYL